MLRLVRFPTNSFIRFIDSCNDDLPVPEDSPIVNSNIITHNLAEQYNLIIVYKRVHNNGQQLVELI